jgi:hypothetical protein
MNDPRGGWRGTLGFLVIILVVLAIVALVMYIVRGRRRRDEITGRDGSTFR